MHQVCCLIKHTAPALDKSTLTPPPHPTLKKKQKKTKLKRFTSTYDMFSVRVLCVISTCPQCVGCHRWQFPLAGGGAAHAHPHLLAGDNGYSRRGVRARQLPRPPFQPTSPDGAVAKSSTKRAGISVPVATHSAFFKGRKEMFYLTTQSTHFVLRLYGIGYMVKDHSDSERGNPLLPLHGLLFPISSKGSFICTIPHTG